MLWLLPFVLLAGCETSRFYGQAIRGQWQMLTAPEPISQVLARTNTPPELAAKLQLVLRLREFATTNLHLPAKSHYLSYADLGRSNVVWNVYAAPEFSLESRTWWYPMVGALKYRGYFREAMARDYAERLHRKEGGDVFVGGVSAYSTLGWFEDPVLNTFIEDDEAELADLIFHELTHQRVFIRGDTDFNEALATAYAQAGVRRWFRATNQPEALARYEQSLAAEREFAWLVLATREKLRTLYATAPTNAPLEAATIERLRAGKQEILAGMRATYRQEAATWDAAGDYANWFAREVNNARLNTVATYLELVPKFAAAMERIGDDEKFFREMHRLGRLSNEARRAEVERLGRP